MSGAPLPSTDRQDAAGSAGTALRHRYPWSIEERAIISALSLIPVVGAWWQLREGVDSPSLAAAASVALLCWTLAFSLYRLGSGRKNRSQITGSLTGAQFSFAGGRFGRGGGSLAGHRHLRVRHKGPERALVFSRPRADDSGLDVEVLAPLRLARPDATGGDALRAAVLAHGGSLQHSDEAGRLVQELRG